MDQLLSYKSFVHAISGAVGGITAISVFYPLNTVRTRLQVYDAASIKQASSDTKSEPTTATTTTTNATNTTATATEVLHTLKYKSVFSTIADIVAEEGYQSLYQGWSAMCIGLGCSNFVYFYAYNGLKAALQKYLKQQGFSAASINTPFLNLFLASVAGAINVLLTTPLWVVGTRLIVQDQRQAAKVKVSTSSSSTSTSTSASASPSTTSEHVPYKGMLDGLTRIYNEEGVAALWNGVLPSLVLVSNPSIQFAAYEMLKKWSSAGGKRKLNALEYFVIGAIAKAIATVLTYPLQVAQSKMRAGHRRQHQQTQQSNNNNNNKHPEEPQYEDTIHCLRHIYEKTGVWGWFRGIEAKLWQTVLTAAFQFLTYEQIAALIFRVMLRESNQIAHAKAAEHQAMEQVPPSSIMAPAAVAPSLDQSTHAASATTAAEVKAQ